MSFVIADTPKLVCSKCGASDVFVRTEGNPCTKGEKVAICGQCKHRGVLRSWDHTGGGEMIAYLQKQEQAKTREF